MSTHMERNHVVHVAGNSARDCSDIERFRKTHPVVTDAKVFVTIIIGTFRRNSRQNWQSGMRTASER